MMFKTEYEKKEFFNHLKNSLVDALKEVEKWKEKRYEEKEEQLLLEVEEYKAEEI